MVGISKTNASAVVCVAEATCIVSYYILFYIISAKLMYNS